MGDFDHKDYEDELRDDTWKDMGEGEVSEDDYEEDAEYGSGDNSGESAELTAQEHSFHVIFSFPVFETRFF